MILYFYVQITDKLSCGNECFEISDIILIFYDVFIQFQTLQKEFIFQ